MNTLLLYTTLLLVIIIIISLPYGLKLIRQYKYKYLKEKSIIDYLLYNHSELISLTDKTGLLQATSSFFNHSFTGDESNRPLNSFKDVISPKGYHDYENIIKYIKRENKPVQDFDIDICLGEQVQRMKLTVIPIFDTHKDISTLIHMLKHNDKNLRHQTDFSRVEKLTNIGQIAAGIAHELNTPLGSIILSADFIKEMENVTSVLEEVDKIKSRAEYCSKVVNELLSYVRKDDDVKKKNDLISIIVKVINLVKTETSKRNITLETSFALKNAFILCMENQIEQLFFNFFSNAFYAIRKNGRIFLSIERDDLLNQIVVTFSDNGCGITQDSIAQVFDPFYTTKPGSEGTGLGLALCKKIMVEHDGKIDVMSDIGKGTSFKLFFPAV